MPYAVAYVHHPICNAHDTGPGHLESRRRLEALEAAMRRDPVLPGVVVETEAQPADLEDLLRVHAPEHVELVRTTAERAARTGRLDWLDPDTAVSGGSFIAALAAAGCAITASELVVGGHACTAFAASRPPGHHAEYDRAGGYCLFSNVAIAARRLQAVHQVGRILVVDWDAHHGNGTQALFWSDPTVFLLSLHLWPHYPETGAADERGGGPGEGHTRNVPLPFGITGAEYRRRFREALDATLSGFRPEVVLVSAGFDCLAGDPEGGMLLEPADLHGVTTDLVERTRDSAGGRVVAILEGGYVPERLGAGAVDVMRALAGAPAARNTSAREERRPRP